MSQAGKGHVPEPNLAEYRELASMARRLKSLGNTLSNRYEHGKANQAWEWSAQFWQQANALRVDLPAT